MKEKRIRERRLDFHSRQRFPFQCADGRVIYQDRRRYPDRRLNSIWVELICLEPGEIPADWGKKASQQLTWNRSR